jgi:hypothetical protein
MGRYLDRKDLCRAELLKVAKAGEKIAYVDLGRLIDVPTRGPWRDLLDALYFEEQSAGRPDLTLVAVRAGIGCSSLLLGKPLDAKDPKRRVLYEQKLQELYRYYRK